MDSSIGSKRATVGVGSVVGILPAPINKLLNLSSSSSASSSASIIPKYSTSLHNLHTRENVPSNLRSMYKKVDFKHPASKNWLIHLHYVRKEFDTCKAIIHEELQRLNGNSEYANYILALIFRSEGKMQESLDRLQVCHHLEPKNVDTIRQIARSLFLLGRHKLAINAYQKSQLLNDDSDWETHYNMGLCYLYMQDLNKARDHMNLSLQARVSHEAFQVLAQIALTRDNIQEAITTYERAVKIFPEHADLLSHLGVLYMKSGRDATSFSKLSTALAFDPTNCKAIVAMASMMQTHEDYDHALGKYKNATATIPDSASLWNNIGMCYFGKKKYVAAISCLKRANYLCAFDWKILHNLGLVHLHMQQYASAFHFLTAAINLKPDQSHNFMLIAVAISHLDDIDHAQEAYEQALKLNKLHATTDSFKLYLNYAVSLTNHKRFPEAHQQLLQAAKHYDKNEANIEEYERELFNRVKTSLQLLDYKFPEGKINTEAVDPESGLTNNENQSPDSAHLPEVSAPAQLEEDESETKFEPQSNLDLI